MEYLPFSLENEFQQRLINTTYFTAKEMFGVFYCLVKALAFLEKIGVAHRDLKLTNTMKTLDGIYKLVDFGEMVFINFFKYFY